jgi:hypothetical protein
MAMGEVRQVRYSLIAAAKLPQLTGFHSAENIFSEWPVRIGPTTFTRSHVCLKNGVLR